MEDDEKEYNGSELVSQGDNLNSRRFLLFRLVAVGYYYRRMLRNVPFGAGPTYFIKTYIRMVFCFLTCSIMGCMHTAGKGLSRWALPYHCSCPTWLKLTSDDIRSRSTNWPGKAWLPHKLVWFWETHMVLFKSVLWQAVQSWGFLSPKVLLCSSRGSLPSDEESCCSWNASWEEQKGC